jgi:hypothetical protein
MKTSIKIVIIALFSIIFVATARADSAPPTYQTTFDFRQDGQPVTQPVTFTVTCYGSGVFDDSNTLLKISEFSNTCPNYGCAFDTSYIFEAYRKNTNYCSVAGTVGGKQFSIKTFLDSSLAGLNCKDSYNAYDGSSYYKDGADVTDELPKDTNGYAFDKICTAEVNIPSDSSNAINPSENPIQTSTTLPTATASDTSLTVSTGSPQRIPPIAEPVQSQNLFARIMRSIRCFFTRLSWNSC